MKENFINVVKEHYLDFKGTVTGKQFLWYIIWYFVCAICLIVIGIIAGMISGILATLVSIISIVFYLGLLVPSIAILVRFLRGAGIIK